MPTARIVFAIGVAAAALLVSSSPEASAQRILERLESRLRSQLEPFRVEPPAPQQDRRGGDERFREVPGGERDPSSGPPTLGIEARRSVETIAGVQVLRFVPESMADEAGLRAGDLIVSINGSPTPTIVAIGRTLRQLDDGDSVTMGVVRQGQFLQLEVPLVGSAQRQPSQRQRPSRRERIAPLPEGQSPERVPPGAAEPPAPGPGAPSDEAATPSDEANSTRLGVEVVDGEDTRGAVVTEVAPQSPAERAGIEVDDRIVAVEGRVVRGARELRDEITRFQPGRPVALQVVRGGQLLELESTLASPDSPGGPDRPGSSDPDRSAPTPDGSPADADQVEDRSDSIIKGLGSLVGDFLKGDQSESKPVAEEEQDDAPENDADRDEPDRSTSDELPPPADEAPKPES